jgi:galactokinase
MKIQINTEANGRINLLGEHLDYNGGSVLPLQINRSIKVLLEDNNNTNEIIINSRQYKEQIIITSDFRKQDGWPDFIIGSCSIIATKYNIKISKIIFNIDSNLPIGIGLSSSAAITVSTLRALIKKYKINVTDSELVELALQVERDFVKVGGGLMDQFASIYGKLNSILFLNTLNKEYELIPLLPDYEFVIIDSGESRILSNSNFNQKKNLCEVVAKKLNVNYLCEIKELNKEIKKQLTNDELKIAKHVILENLRVEKGKLYLLHTDYDSFGRLMTESHLSLKNNYEVSTMNLDKLVELANTFGALGSKLTGAGFGGAIVTLIKKDLVHDLKKYIIKHYSNAKFL